MNEYFDNIVYNIDKINGIVNQRDGITYEITNHVSYKYKFHIF